MRFCDSSVAAPPLSRAAAGSSGVGSSLLASDGTVAADEKAYRLLVPEQARRRDNRSIRVWIQDGHMRSKPHTD